MSSSPKGLQNTLNGAFWTSESRTRRSGLRTTSSTNSRRKTRGTPQANKPQPRPRSGLRQNSTPQQGEKAVPYNSDGDEEHSTEDGDYPGFNFTSRNSEDSRDENMGPMKDNGTVLQCSTLPIPYLLIGSLQTKGRGRPKLPSR